MQRPRAVNKYDFDKAAVFNSRLDAYPFPVDAAGKPLPLNVFKMRATGKVSGAPEATFNKCSLKFIQVIQVRSFEVSYAGKRAEEGAVQWNWQGQFLQWNLDSLVREGFTSAPFQFDDSVYSRQPPNTLVANLGDTPGASIPLVEFNRETQKDNYLWMFIDRRRFTSIAVFVHPDGSRQMLEGWNWKFARAVKMKWPNLKPEIDGPSVPKFEADSSGFSVFGNDTQYENIVKANNIANKITYAAMKDVKNSPNIGYFAIKDPAIRPGTGFWAP